MGKWPEDADPADADAGTYSSDGGRRMRGRRYYKWASLLRRAFGVDVLRCPRCGGAQRLLVAIQDSDSIGRVLRAMKLPFDAPELAAGRWLAGWVKG